MVLFDASLHSSQHWTGSLQIYWIECMFVVNVCNKITKPSLVIAVMLSEGIPET